MAQLNKPDDTEAAKPNLSFVTTEELIEELEGRHTGILICRITKMDTEKALIRYAGGMFLCLGLARQAVHDLTHHQPSKSGDGE